MKIKTIAIIGWILLAVNAYAGQAIDMPSSDVAEPVAGVAQMEDLTLVDSLEVIKQRARYGEKRAYKTLGDCYRYGIEGVDQSVFMSLAYYKLAGMDIFEKTLNSESGDTEDYLCLTIQLIDKIESRDWEGARNVITLLEEDGFYDANIVKEFLGDLSEDRIDALVEHNVFTADARIDRMIFTLMGYGTLARFWESDDIQEKVMSAIAKKCPYFANYIATNLYSKGSKFMDHEKFVEKEKEVMTLLELADKEALLDREGAAILYNYYLFESEDGRRQLSQDERDRLATVAELQ